MNVTPTNGDYRYSPATRVESAPPQAGAADLVDDALVATIVHQVMGALPALPAPVVQPSVDRDESTGKAAWLDFAQALATMLASSSELRAALQPVLANSARKALADGGVELREHDLSALLDGYALKSKGGTVVRAFWWGFHIQISHEDLQVFLGGANAVNTIVDLIGGNIPSPAQPFIKLAAVFVAGALALLGGLDRGRGVYISMSWFAPGIFVPTSV